MYSTSQLPQNVEHERNLVKLAPHVLFEVQIGRSVFAGCGEAQFFTVYRSRSVLQVMCVITRVTYQEPSNLEEGG